MGLVWSRIRPGATIQDIRQKLGSSTNNIVWGGSSTNAASAYGTGYLATMYLGYLASGASAINSSALSSGLDNVISRIMNGYSLSSVIRDVSGGRYTDLMDF